MKKITFIILSILIILYFILTPQAAVTASQKGIMTWWEIVFPTLFPCIIMSNLLINTNALSNINNEKTLKLIIIICGLMLGFPIGAKLTSEFYKKNYICKKDAQILCAFTNNISPAYVGSIVVTQTLGKPEWLFLTYLILYFPSVFFCVLQLLKNNQKSKKAASRFQLNMQIIDAGIISGFETLIRLCGYITLFSIIVSIVQTLLHNSKVIIYTTGLLEITNGISVINQYPLHFVEKYLLLILFLSFGGLSFLFQTKTIIHSTDLSLKKYIVHKILSSIMSLSTAILILFFFRII